MKTPSVKVVGFHVPIITMSQKAFSTKEAVKTTEKECVREEYPREGGQPIIIRRDNRAEQNRQKEAEEILALQRKYWDEDFRAVDMLLKDTGVGYRHDDVVKLINEALEFAYRNRK